MTLGRGARLSLPGYRGTVDLGTLLALLAPVIAIQLVLVVLALRDLAREERRVQGGNKWAWVAVICLLGLIGPMAYFWVGREPE